MPNKKYKIEPLEIAGEYALFSDPCGGSELSSFPFPTPPAIKGIIESIHYMPSAIFKIEKVHICSPIKYDQFGFNASVSHLRKDNQIQENNSLQRRFSVLRDVVYQIFGYIENLPPNEIMSLKIKDKYREVNHAHACQEILNRRIKRGAYTNAPFLGKKMFPASYCGPIRRNENGEPIHSPCPQVNLTIPSMPLTWFNKDQLGTRIKPSFILNVKAVEGVVVFSNSQIENSQIEKGELLHA